MESGTRYVFVLALAGLVTSIQALAPYPICTLGYVNCFVNPCRFATCPNHPTATCRPNYCGGCNAEWFIGPLQVNCQAIDPCATVRCSRPPCPAGWRWGKANPTDCCDTCLPPLGSCRLANGTTVLNGATWKPSPCEFCTCVNGRQSCAIVDCAYPVCPNGARPVPQPGQCCPSCPVDPCALVLCPIPRCRAGWTLGKENPTDCCSICLPPPGSCKLANGDVILNGGKWQPDPCTFCTCVDGQERCFTVSCARPICPNGVKPVTPRGKCCPVCPDPCAAVTCLVPRCPAGWTLGKKNPGDCCAICLPPKGSCKLENGTVVLDGTTFQVDCSFCRCVAGKVTCLRRPCELPYCPNGATSVTRPGDCCPTCPDPTCVEKNGDIYEEGDTWNRDPCTRCICRNGIAVCSRLACRPAPCQPGYEHVQLPTQCCPVCRPLEQCREKNGDVYSNGDTWKRDACTTCTCVRGQAQCRVTACPPLACPYGAHPVEVPGQCCPVCENRGCFYLGRAYTHGQNFLLNGCQSCTCSNGAVRCYNYRPCTYPIRSPSLSEAK